MRCRLRILFALLLLFGACDGRGPPPERPAEPLAAGTISWHPLGTWSGSGDRQTESFDVTTGVLRLTWETRGESAPGEGRLRVVLYSAISGRPLQTIVEAHGIVADTAFVADEPRVAYLQIESERLDWHLTLDEAVPGAVGSESARE